MAGSVYSRAKVHELTDLDKGAYVQVQTEPGRMFIGYLESFIGHKNVIQIRAMKTPLKVPAGADIEFLEPRRGKIGS